MEGIKAELVVKVNWQEVVRRVAILGRGWVPALMAQQRGEMAN